jgi:23S rRNA pseudouridine2605 synthase
MNTRKTRAGKTSAPSKTGAKKKVVSKKTKPSDASPKKKATEKDKKRYHDFKEKVRKGDPMPNFDENAVRLNKFLSNAGVASRREADVLIQTGVISVNDVIITEMGHKIAPGDVVKYDGETINSEKKRYVLLNKPKDYIATLDDPMGRKTVMKLVEKACKEQVYPIGKLEKETMGLLLFTNDGDLMKKLTHPRYKATKIYHAELNKALTVEDLELLRAGVFLDDGKVHCENVEYVKSGTSRDIGIELTSGKNKVVRRLFESLGYAVVKLDRVKYAGLTKKDLPRGFIRHLTDKEVAFLKMS